MANLSLVKRRVLAIGLSVGATLFLGLGYLLLRPGPALLTEPGPHGSERAACLDCHVPFSGTPSTRCLGPGCHGDLATGTPPRDGPVLPVRFHVVLRGEDCRGCHAEHRSSDPSTAKDPHRGVPPGVLNGRCGGCHLDLGPEAHDPADLRCGQCHGLETWTRSGGPGLQPPK